MAKEDQRKEMRRQLCKAKIVESGFLVEMPQKMEKLQLYYNFSIRSQLGMRGTC
jgi:hypothetical protein